MASLKNKIRLMEYEIGNDRALIAHEYQLLRTNLATPKGLAMGFLGGLALGFMMTQKSVTGVKRHVAKTLPLMIGKMTPGLSHLLPLIFR